VLELEKKQSTTTIDEIFLAEEGFQAQQEGRRGGEGGGDAAAAATGTRKAQKTRQNDCVRSAVGTGLVRLYALIPPP
jgi:hypothetical protein